jgi:CHASE3 domain sensor protein
MIELVLALGAAMVLANVIAIVRRNYDKDLAKQALQHSNRTSRQTNATLAKNQIKDGKATLAVAPLGRSLVYIAIGLIAMTWSALTLFAS